jgi:hypothetical protein
MGAAPQDQVPQYPDCATRKDSKACTTQFQQGCGQSRSATVEHVVCFVGSGTTALARGLGLGQHQQRRVEPCAIGEADAQAQRRYIARSGVGRRVASRYGIRGGQGTVVSAGGTNTKHTTAPRRGGEIQALARSSIASNVAAALSNTVAANITAQWQCNRATVQT